MESLTAKVLEFQRSGQGLDTLVRALAPRIYGFPHRVLGADEDTCSDFYLFFWPRLERLVHNFRDQGKPFESYLASVLYWQLRTFSRRKLSSDRGWTTSLRLEVPSSPEPGAPQAAGEVKAARAHSPGARETSRAGQRNLLFLALKCCRFLDPARLQEAARRTGVDPERLEQMRRALQAGREGAARRLAWLGERRNNAFSRGRLAEEELAGCVDPDRAAELRARICRYRQRMRAAADRMSRVRLAPTNAEIAALLGVPKGTVDSGLFWLKRRGARGYDPDHEISA